MMGSGLEGFLLEAPHVTALAADFDGTLVPLRPRPDAVPPAFEAGGALSALAQRLAAVGVISGRPEAAVRRLLGDPTGVRVLGSYGIEGSSSPLPPRAMVSQLREAVERIEGVHTEEKPRTIAVHYRQASPGTSEFLREQVGRIALQYGWTVAEGKAVLDVVPRGGGLKGDAALELCRQAGATRIAYLGDDVPDLDAVRACRAAGLEVFACFVLDRESPEHIAREASALVANPEALVRMLRRSVSSLPGHAA